MAFTLAVRNHKRQQDPRPSRAHAGEGQVTKSHDAALGSRAHKQASDSRHVIPDSSRQSPRAPVHQAPAPGEASRDSAFYVPGCGDVKSMTRHVSKFEDASDKRGSGAAAQGTALPPPAGSHHAPCWCLGPKGIRKEVSGCLQLLVPDSGGSQRASKPEAPRALPVCGFLAPNSVHRRPTAKKATRGGAR